VVLEFNQGLGDSDRLVLGLSNNGSEEFEFEYDLPEPPVKPVNEGLLAYLTKNTLIDTTFRHSKLNWEYKPELSDSEPEEAVWDFALDLSEAGQVAITAVFTDLPSTHTVNIQIGAFEAELEDSGTEIFTANNSGHFVGTITISNGLDRDLSNIKQDSFASYPNPFNPETTFRFNLKEDTDIKLQIYNIRGQLVRTLRDGLLRQGEYKVTWNGKNDNGKMVASGLYFARFKTKRQEQITKLLLLK
jgi:hypothetical protein